jgi:4-carboxymuconolactone decarboxylase
MNRDSQETEMTGGSLAAAALVALASTAYAQEARFKPLAENDMTDAQRKVYREIAGGPRGGVRGPFIALLRSPELTDRVQKVGEYIRFESSLPARLNEFAILITARYWNAQYEWYAHHPLALKAGLSAAVAADLAQGRRPAGMQDDEAAVYDFCTELHEKKAVGDKAYKAALDRFGERGVVDLIGVSGYYTLVSMVLNVDRSPLPGGATPPLPELK